MSARGFVVRQAQREWGTARDRSLHVVLVEPEIPGNTGNIGRLCAGTQFWLHLVRPLGFELDDRYLSRAGLDYWPHVQLCVHDSFEEVESIFGVDRLHLFSSHASARHTEVRYRLGDALVFGRESRGLGRARLERLADRAVRIPKGRAVRSLNLSNAVAVACYEALRQLDFAPLGEDLPQPWD